MQPLVGSWRGSVGSQMSTAHALVLAQTVGSGRCSHTPPVHWSSVQIDMSAVHGVPSATAVPTQPWLTAVPWQWSVTVHRFASLHGSPEMKSWRHAPAASQWSMVHSSPSLLHAVPTIAKTPTAVQVRLPAVPMHRSTVHRFPSRSHGSLGFLPWQERSLTACV